jgi:hypothetical protein
MVVNRNRFTIPADPVSHSLSPRFALSVCEKASFLSHSLLACMCFYQESELDFDTPILDNISVT